MSATTFTDMQLKDAKYTTEIIYPQTEVKIDESTKAREAMSKVELQQLIISNQLQGTEHDNILKTQNLTAESIQLQQEYQTLKEENFRLKEIVAKINRLDDRKASAVEALTIKQFNEQKATLCKLIDRKQKLNSQLDLLNEQYDPNERIRIDDVPGMDRIRELELGVENMKLKLNEASNINQNFKQMLQALHEKHIKFDKKAKSQKQLVVDANNEYQNSVETRKQAEEAAVIMEANFQYRMAQVQNDTIKRRNLLQQRKEQVRTEKEKTDYICSQQYMHEEVLTTQASQIMEDNRYRGLSEYYREHISNDVKIINPYEFYKACKRQESEQKGCSREQLQKRLDEQNAELSHLRTRIADSEYEVENNKNMQKKELQQLQDSYNEKKQLKSQAYNKYSEVRQKSVYLKTALSSILDKMGANKLVSEEQINLMLGDDVLIDSLSSGDRRIFDSFVKEAQTADIISQSSAGYQYQLMVLIILSKLRWMNEMWREIENDLAIQRVETGSTANRTEKIPSKQDTRDESQNITIQEQFDITRTEANYDDLVLDDDEEELKSIMEQEAQKVIKIELPSSRPSSARAPLGGTRGRMMELEAPPQQLQVIDRQSMKERNEQFALSMSMNKAKDD